MARDADCPKFGKSTLVDLDKRLVFPADFGPCEVVVKSLGVNARTGVPQARLLVIREDQREPWFDWDAKMDGYRVSVAP